MTSYDLDRGPVVLATPRWTSALFAVAGAFLAWGNAPYALAGSWTRLALTLLFVVLGASSLIQVFRPSRVVIDRDGLTWSGWLGARTLSWRQVDGFKRLRGMVVFRRLDEPQDLLSRWVGGAGAIGFPYSIRPDELVKVLDAAKARWG